MDKALEHHHLCPDHAGEVIARLASFLAFALDITNSKPPADQLTEVDTADHDLTPSFALIEDDAMLGVLALDRLRLDQRDIARFGVVEVAIPFEPATGVSCHSLHGMRGLAMLAR